MFYNVTCVSADAPTLTGATQNEFILFTQADGVAAGIDYTCHLTMTVTAYNGTNLANDSAALGSIETQTTPISEKVSITTLEAKGEFLFVHINKRMNHFIGMLMCKPRGAKWEHCIKVKHC